jgi:hypothetical protein
MDQVAFGAMDKNALEKFEKMRTALPADAPSDIVDDLVALTSQLEGSNAKASASRMYQLADYATVLPPESLPRLLDSTATLDELEEAYSNRYRLGLLGIVRNVLALVPLLLTWWALSAATNAYQVEVRIHPDMVYQPFLVLWENGFNQGFWPTFSTIAGVDAVLFAFIIGLTGFIHSLEQHAHKRARQVVANMDRVVTRLVATLGHARMTLSGNPSDWAAAVANVIKTAMSETRQLSKAGESVVKAATVATETARIAIDQIALQTREYITQVKGEFAETVRQLHEEDKVFLAQLLRQADDRLIAAHEASAQRMSDLYAQANAEYKRQAQASQEAVERTREFTEQIRREAHEALEQINEENRRFFADALRDAQDLVRQAADRADQITGGQLAPLVEEFRQTLVAFKGEIEEYRRSSAGLVGSMTQIGDVTRRLGESAQAFTDTATEMDTHVQAIAQTHTQFAQRVESVAVALGAAADATSTAAIGMQASATQVLSAIERTGELTSEVIQASQQWSAAQASLKAVTDALRGATQSLRDARVVVSVWPFGKRKAA